jgi:hypothetical protein
VLLERIRGALLLILLLLLLLLGLLCAGEFGIVRGGMALVVHAAHESSFSLAARFPIQLI